MSRVSRALRYNPKQQRLESHQLNEELSPKENILKLPTTKLEGLLSTYISRDQSSGKLSPPEWWPHDLLFYSNSFDSMRKEALGSSLDWPAILRHALLKYCLHHKKSTEEIVRLSRKRPLSENLEGNKQEHNTPKRHKQNTEIPSKLKLSPVVRVVDVLNPIPPKEVTQESFMTGLKLVPATAPPRKTLLAPQNTGSKKYPNNIPFSSIVGQILVRREMYTISTEMYTRKAERLEYHLQTSNPIPVPPNKDYEVTFNSRKKTSDRVYRFPTRQHLQGRRYIKNLKSALCTPCSVPLERINARKYGEATVVIKDLKVMLNRM